MKRNKENSNIFEQYTKLLKEDVAVETKVYVVFRTNEFDEDVVRGIFTNLQKAKELELQFGNNSWVEEFPLDIASKGNPIY